MLKRIYIRLIIVLLAHLITNQAVLATAYYYPASTLPVGDVAAVAPQTLQTGDSLEVNSGILETASGNSSLYTVDFVRNGTVLVDANGTISYAGSNSAGAALYSLHSANVNHTINVYGTISAGTGTYAINENNTLNRGGNDTVNVNLYNNAVVSGQIVTNSPGPFNIYVCSNNVTLNGAINLAANGLGGGLNVGKDSNGTAYANTVFNISNNNLSVANINLYNNATVNVNYPFSNDISFNLTNSTLNINAAITNVAFIYSDNQSNIYLNSAFSFYYDGLTTGAGMQIGNLVLDSQIPLDLPGPDAEMIINALIVNMQNANTYGQLSLTGNILDPQINDVEINYTGGYFSTGTYTVFTSTEALTAAPTVTVVPQNTSTLTFGTPTATTTLVTIPITRTKFFYDIATNALAYEIAKNLEVVGANNPSAAAVVVLDALELSPTAEQLNDALLQLTPNAGIATQSFTVQNLTLQQVSQRVHTLRGTKTTPISGYAAGDKLKRTAKKTDQNQPQHMWLRGFGEGVNQGVINDVNGYTAGTVGLTLGYDKDVNADSLYGIAAVYAYSRVNDKVNIGSVTNVNSYQVLVYGSKDFDLNRDYYLDWVGAAAYNHYNGDRKMNLITQNLTAFSEYNNYNFAAKATLGKIYKLKKHKFNIIPEFSAQYTYIGSYNYQETGAPGADLYVNQPNSNILQLGLGVRQNSTLKAKQYNVVPEVYIAGLYNVISTNKNTRFQFVAGGGEILTNMGPNNGTFRAGANLTILNFTNKLSLQFNVDLELQKHYIDYSGFMNFRYLL